MNKLALVSISVVLFSVFETENVFAQGMKAIVYTSWGRLCSVSQAPADTPSCIKSKKEYSSPAWKPRGDSLVVESGYHDRPHHLVILGADGREENTVQESSDFTRPVWSPDGRHIYALNDDLGNAVGMWDENGKHFRLIAVKGGEGRYRFLQMISFSPSGRFAAILADQFKQMLIAEVHEDKLQVKAILPKDFAYIAQSIWLDESQLLFVGKKDGKRQELWVLNINDGSVHKVGITGFWIRDFLTLSPDHKTVVVSALPDNHEKETEWDLWQYSLDSGKVTQLTNGTEDVSPSWRTMPESRSKK
jgi:Tol biopolymer transport system component